MSPIDLKHRQLQTQIVGIVGLGEIGQELTRRAAAFGMNVIGVDPREDLRGIIDLPELSEVWKPEDLNQLLEVADYVVVAAPHTPETVGMFACDQFQAMKSDAILINIGRGALVRLDDLVTSLRQGEIGGAALDVYEIEPLPQSHPLWAMENVILTPHIAGYAPCIAERHLGVVLENVRAFDQGAPLQNLVNKTLWY